MSVRSYDEILKEIEETAKAQKEADIAASDQMYDAQKQTVTDSYNTQIQEAKSAYQNQLDENAVQKLIHERQIAENMANLGLIDSGLNRTQQTAAQLSYANNNTKINLARQKAVDALAQAMTAKMSELDAGKLAAAEGIRSNYAQNARSQAVDVYKNEAENETARQKAAYEAQVKQMQVNNDNAAAKIAARQKLIETLSDSKIPFATKTAFVENYKQTYGYDASDAAVLEKVGYTTSSLFKSSVLTQNEFLKRKRASTNGSLRNYNTYAEYIDGTIQSWYNQGKLTAAEVVSLLEYYGI